MNTIKSIIYALLISTVFIACSKPEVEAVSKKIVPVKLAAVQTRDITIPVYCSGMLFTTQQIRLSFKTGGIIAKLAAREGQTVRAGEVLAQLNLDEIDAHVKQAQSGYDKALRDYERVSALFADSVATLEQMQNVETQLNMARSTLQIARFNFEYSSIKAPSDGKILKRFAETNELVGPGTPVFYFGSGNHEWIVRAGVADRDIIRLEIGDSAAVTFDAYPGKTFIGSVSEIAQAADPQNGTFEVEILLDAEGKRMAAGFVAQATLLPRSKHNATLVPVSAILEARGHEANIYTVRDGLAVQLAVEIGSVLGDEIVIREGLRNVEHIVTDGAAYLKSGDKVKIQ